MPRGQVFFGRRTKKNEERNCAERKGNPSGARRIRGKEDGRLVGPLPRAAGDSWRKSVQPLRLNRAPGDSWRTSVGVWLEAGMCACITRILT